MGEGLGNGCGGVRGGWKGKGRLGATGTEPFCITDIRPEKSHLAEEQGQKVRSFRLERGPAGFSGVCLWRVSASPRDSSSSVQAGSAARRCERSRGPAHPAAQEGRAEGGPVQPRDICELNMPPHQGLFPERASRSFAQLQS